MEKDNRVTIISILLAIIAFVILGFILYYKLSKPVEEKPKDNNELEKTEEPIKIDETNYDELSKELYQILGDNPEFRYEDKVTFETLSESVRDSIVINYLVDKCEDVIVIEKTRFLDNYKKIFNHDKESDEGICTVKDDDYECNFYCNENSLKIYKVFDKYEKTSDSIIIYENVGHLDYYDDGKVYLEEHAGDSTVIASFDSLSDLLDTSVTYKLPSYKHIFKKLNETYYWQSSELVKQ